MDYKCKCCGCEFDEPREYYEYHGFTNLPEKWSCCPNCGGEYTDDFEDEEDCDE